MKTVVQLKKDVSSAGILCIIIGEFSHRSELGQIILLGIDDDLEIDFYGNVCLSV